MNKIISLAISILIIGLSGGLVGCNLLVDCIPYVVCG